MTAQTICNISPQGPQDDFLRTSAHIAIYGGAAGGGKTFALLMEALRYRNIRGFGAVVFRRNAVQVRNKGGLWDTSYELFHHLVDRQKNLLWNGNSLQELL